MTKISNDIGEALGRSLSLDKVMDTGKILSKRKAYSVTHLFGMRDKGLTTNR